MEDPNDFWQRPVTDKVTIELVPGDQPHLRIKGVGESYVQLELMEARELIEVLTVAVGELFILKKDPTALAQLQRLLEDDVTLVDGRGEPQAATSASRISGHVQGLEVVRSYQRGRRDFHKADLRLADLGGADLRGVDLSEANMAGAILNRANLFQANLERANLSRANLDEAGLFQASLREADLSHASLRKAYMAQANMRDATITDAQLAQAKVLTGATLPDGSEHD